MPEGSSSEAPVTNPGPSTINTRLMGFFSRSSFDSSGSFRDFRPWLSVVVHPSDLRPYQHSNSVSAFFSVFSVFSWGELLLTIRLTTENTDNGKLFKLIHDHGVLTKQRIVTRMVTN